MTETTTTETAADLEEARSIVRDLASMRDALMPSDRRFVDSWQSYLNRTGDGAAIGPHRLAMLRSVHGRATKRTAANASRSAALQAYKDAKADQAGGYEPS